MFKFAHHIDEPFPNEDTVLPEVGALNNHELLLTYANRYGDNSIGWEIDPNTGKNYPTHLILNEKTAAHEPIDWANDPGRDIVGHEVSTWSGAGESSLTLKKTSDRYSHIVNGIKTYGHFSPYNYAQLSKTNVVGHPIGDGPQAMFIFKTPTVSSWEQMARYSDSNNDFEYKSSAIEVSVGEARQLTQGAPIDIIETFQQSNKNRGPISYIPPSKICGVLEFSNRQKFNIFNARVDQIIYDYTTMMGSEFDEKTTIERFLGNKQNGIYSIMPSTMKYRVANRSIQSIAPTNADFISPMDKEELMFLYGAMITRAKTEQAYRILCKYKDEPPTPGGMDRKSWTTKMKLYFQNLRPSFTATQLIREDAFKIAEDHLRKLDS